MFSVLEFSKAVHCGCSLLHPQKFLT